MKLNQSCKSRCHNNNQQRRPLHCKDYQLNMTGKIWAPQHTWPCIASQQNCNFRMELLLSCLVLKKFSLASFSVNFSTRFNNETRLTWKNEQKNFRKRCNFRSNWLLFNRKSNFLSRKICRSKFKIPDILNFLI